MRQEDENQSLENADTTLSAFFVGDAVSIIRTAFNDEALTELYSILNGKKPLNDIDPIVLRKRLHFWALKTQRRIHPGPVITKEIRKSAKALFRNLSEVTALSEGAPKDLQHLLDLPQPEPDSLRTETWTDWLPSSQEILLRLNLLAATPYRATRQR